MKRCATCQLEKSEDEYHIDKSKWDGLNRRCKSCFNKWRSRIGYK